MIEEGQPNYLEQNVNTILRQADINTKLLGKGMLPIAGEYTTAILRDGLQKFLEKLHPEALPVIDVPETEPAAQATATATATAIPPATDAHGRSEEHTSELQSLMRISYAVFCLKKKKKKENNNKLTHQYDNDTHRQPK